MLAIYPARVDSPRDLTRSREVVHLVDEQLAVVEQQLEESAPKAP